MLKTENNNSAAPRSLRENTNCFAFNEKGGSGFCLNKFSLAEVELKIYGCAWRKFDVQRIEHRASDFVLAPFNARGGADANFWLAVNENDNENANGLDFVMTTTLQANTPYIIAMPNNETYKAWQNIVGAVTFSADEHCTVFF